MERLGEEDLVLGSHLPRGQSLHLRQGMMASFASAGAAGTKFPGCMLKLVWFTTHLTIINFVHKNMKCNYYLLINSSVKKI